MSTVDYRKKLSTFQDEINQNLADYCQNLPQNSKLHQAMAYSVLNGGKRLRPVLTLATAELFSDSYSQAMPFARAVELLHCYSLVHDDLPAMDDDDLRRGKPTTHKAFDEATAILAGDGLLTSAFLQIAKATLSPQQISLGCLCLAQFAGEFGMVAGQALDLALESSTLSAENPTVAFDRLVEVQSLKTGCLLLASCHLGAIAGGASPEEILAISTYAEKLGRAFQIRDDILDATGSVDSLGKPIGSDNKLGKATFYTLLGQDQAQDLVESLTAEAKSALGGMPKAGFLLWLAEDLIKRDK